MHFPDIRLLKDALAIIESVPDESVNLGQWRLKQGKTLTEGTVCCPAGWLTLHPRFKELGLTFDGPGRPAFGLYRGYAALASLFRIDTEEAYALFRPVLPDESFMPDKKVWLNRMRMYLARNAHRYPH